MIPEDAIALRDYLRALADVMPRAKPVTDAAVRLWFKRLERFGINDVADVLERWTDDHDTMPVPSEVLKRLTEIRAARMREAEAKAQAVPAGQISDPSSPRYRAFLERMQGMQARPVKADEVWGRLRARQAAGETLLPIQLHYLSKVDGRGAVGLSEADREAAEERAAIQAESAGR